jgi:hypothetical protein
MCCGRKSGGSKKRGGTGYIFRKPVAGTKKPIIDESKKVQSKDDRTQDPK